MSNSNNNGTATTFSQQQQLQQQQLQQNKHRSWLSLFYEQHCSLLFPMLGWFLFSTLLTSYNKKVFGHYEGGGLAFPCPLFMTSIHFGAQWIFAEILCALQPEFYGSDRIRQMSWKEYWNIALPCGLVTSADIGLSNLSWATLTLTFYTMIKSSTPVFVLFWAWLFGLNRITGQLLAVILLITIGEFITVHGQVDAGDFHSTGFILCLSAAILSGARWTLVQLKIQSLVPPLKTTIATMRLLAPSMFVSLFLTSLAMEQPWISLGPDLTMPAVIKIVALGLFGALFAICMILCEFYLIMHANALVLAVGGVIKEVLTIVVGVVFFGDEFTGKTALGCAVIFVGIILYKFANKTDKHPKDGGNGIFMESKYSDNDDLAPNVVADAADEEEQPLTASTITIGEYHNSDDGGDDNDAAALGGSKTKGIESWAKAEQQRGLLLQQRTTAGNAAPRCANSSVGGGSIEMKESSSTRALGGAGSLSMGGTL